jgi:peroxiredoxin
MSHRAEEKELRRQQRLAAEAAAARAERRERTKRRIFWGGGGLLATALVAAAFALPSSSGGAGAAPAPMDHGGHAAAVTIGAPAPDFSVTDVVADKPLSLADLKGRRTLLFFSEGASCQACLVQAAHLQKSGALKREKIGLVSISTDTPDVLEQVAGQYQIATPLLADADGAMMKAYGQLGRGGMGHPDTGGHSFVLLDERGRVIWERAYSEMYVKTGQLLADMKA